MKYNSEFHSNKFYRKVFTEQRAITDIFLYSVKCEPCQATIKIVLYTLSNSIYLIPCIRGFTGSVKCYRDKSIKSDLRSM